MRHCRLRHFDTDWANTSLHTKHRMQIIYLTAIGKASWLVGWLSELFLNSIDICQFIIVKSTDII